MSDSEPEGQIARIAFIVPDVSSVLHEYNALAVAIRSNGHQVRCFASSQSREAVVQLDKQGIYCTEFALVPEGFAVFPERKAISELATLLNEWNPTHVLAVGGIELTHGILATRKLNKPFVVAVIELLPVFSARGKNDEIETRPSASSFKRALELADRVFCLNEKTPKQLRLHVPLKDFSKISVSPRCGTDLNEFQVAELPGHEDGVVFHLDCPLARRYGVLEYCAAAKLVKERYGEAKFVLSGPPGKFDDAISLDLLEPYADIVTYAGIRALTRDDLAKCHVFVSLSRDETLSLTCMRALSIGRPLIAADTPSGREFVDERVNGCVVDPSDVDDIASSMMSFLRRRDLLPAMARASRQKAMHKLDQHSLVAKLLPALRISN